MQILLKAFARQFARFQSNGLTHLSASMKNEAKDQEKNGSGKDLYLPTLNRGVDEHMKLII